ncbi:MAG: hypothetical protein GX288_08000 [Clostridiales bacterium]|nr:hypothetical protein [Clostridiales bacterium]
MKLKKAYMYSLSFICLSILFTLCYYLSYQRALNEFNNNAVKRREEYIQLTDQDTTTPIENEDDAVSVDTHSPEIILPTTDYILEIYDKKTGETVRENLNPPSDLVGRTREGVEDYLDEYMRDIKLSEYNKGLLAFELLSFSEKQVVLRKTYDEEIVPYRYYVVVKDGYVVVYNSDLKSVFRYTHIDASTLPEEDRVKLSYGIPVNTQDELFSLLESYSS